MRLSYLYYEKPYTQKDSIYIETGFSTEGMNLVCQGYSRFSLGWIKKYMQKTCNIHAK